MITGNGFRTAGPVQPPCNSAVVPLPHFAIWQAAGGTVPPVRKAPRSLAPSKYGVWPSSATAMSANYKFSAIPCALGQRKLLRPRTGALRLRAFAGFEKTPQALVNGLMMSFGL